MEFDIFIFSIPSRPALGPTHSAFRCILLLFFGVKQPQNENWPLTEVKNEWSHTSICLHAPDCDSFVLIFGHDLNLRNVTPALPSLICEGCTAMTTSSEIRQWRFVQTSCNGYTNMSTSSEIRQWRFVQTSCSGYTAMTTSSEIRQWRFVLTSCNGYTTMSTSSEIRHWRFVLTSCNGYTAMTTSSEIRQWRFVQTRCKGLPSLFCILGIMATFWMFMLLSVGQ